MGAIASRGGGAQVREYVTLYLAWSHVPLFMTLVMSFASLDAVEDAQARFRACNRRTLQAAKVRDGAAARRDVSGRSRLKRHHVVAVGDTVGALEGSPGHAVFPVPDR